MRIGRVATGLVAGAVAVMGVGVAPAGATSYPTPGLSVAGVAAVGVDVGRPVYRGSTVTVAWTLHNDAAWAVTVDGALAPWVPADCDPGIPGAQASRPVAPGDTVVCTTTTTVPRDWTLPIISITEVFRALAVDGNPGWQATTGSQIIVPVAEITDIQAERLDTGLARKRETLTQVGQAVRAATGVRVPVSVGITLQRNLRQDEASLVADLATATGGYVDTHADLAAARAVLAAYRPARYTTYLRIADRAQRVSARIDRRQERVAPRTVAAYHLREAARSADGVIGQVAHVSAATPVDPYRAMLVDARLLLAASRTPM